MLVDGALLYARLCLRFLLTNPASVGYDQNPISVYYCYRKTSSKEGASSCAGGLPSPEMLQTCVAEVCLPADSLTYLPAFLLFCLAACLPLLPALQPICPAACLAPDLPAYLQAFPTHVL